MWGGGGLAPFLATLLPSLNKSNITADYVAIPQTYLPVKGALNPNLLNMTINREKFWL